MNILIFNCGSSSLSCKIFSEDDKGVISAFFSAKAHRVAVTGSEPSFIEFKTGDGKDKIVTPLKTHREAAHLMIRYLNDKGIKIDLIGHRFVHGGPFFRSSVFIDKTVLNKLNLCVPLAPLHNPVSLSVISECAGRLPGARQYVTFDSAFHSTIPDQAYTYPLPKKIVEKYGYRKYGFHGISYSYIAKQVPKILKTRADKLKIVACHLGTGGSSVAAIKGGKSMDTSMGYSPLMGLVMSTRCGDIDPLLSLYLMVKFDYRPDDLLNMLTEKSGLLGIAEYSSDIRDIISKNEEEQSALALNMYVHRLKKYIGSFVAVLGGIDALVFTDDIGARNAAVREKVCAGMDWCGIRLDRAKNHTSTDDKINIIGAKGGKVKIISMPTEEELTIAAEGFELAK